MRVERVLVAAGVGGFVNDDQAAIRAGARRDGFLYAGEPLTPGFRRIRQPAAALSVLLVLEDGVVVHGDATSVQYAGAGGREPVLDPAAGLSADGLAGLDVSSFRASSERLAALGLSTALRYGVSQALLAAAAHAGRRTVAEVVADEYATGAPLRAVPIFAQSGEDRRGAIDRMVLREVDELPHGLINNARELVGADGSLLLEYVAWVRDRVLALRDRDDYQPVLHFDTYGTLGEVFDVRECADFLLRLGEAAAPLKLRIEQPMDGGSRDGQIRVLAELRARLDGRVELIADEWCNTLDDVRAFVAADCADMIQVKTPDLGGLDASIEALLACKAGGIGAYCGGSCTDTERAAQVITGLAMGVDADLLLARPGMGVDEAVMVTRNEMSRTRVLAA
jgi:methylaspartate ammonia-lyase